MSVSHSIRERPARILAIAVAGFLLVATFLGVLLITREKSDPIDAEHLERSALVENAASSVEVLVNQSLADQRSFIDRYKRELLTEDVAGVTQLLRQFTEDAPLFSSEALLLRGGEVFATWPENPAVIGRDLLREFDHLKKVERDAESSVSGSIRSPVFFGQTAVQAASPILGDKREVDAIFVSGFLIDGSAMQDYVKGLDGGPEGLFFIVDGSGEVIAASEELGPDFELIQRETVQHHSPIPAAEWVLTLRQDRDPPAVTTERWKPLALILVLILAVGVLGYLAYRFLSRLAEAEEKLADNERLLVMLERERDREIERVEQLDSEKDEFVSMVSHELRGPLTIMKGWVEMILEGRFGELTEQQDDYLTISRNNIERMFAIVEDLLTVSKAESGRLDMIPEQVSIAEVIGELAVGVEQIVEDRGLRLDVELEPDIPSIEADRHRVEQVMTNFLSNAIKFTPEGGTVTMRARTDDGGVVAEVSDTGLGIPSAEQGDLFKKFFRTSNVKGRVPGTGLGLAISKAIVERHGGRVGVKSVEGEGSTFWMWLPANSIGVQSDTLARNEQG
jgi:signal transduction histidine kinase